MTSRIEYRKKYYESNKQAILESNKKYYLKNKATIQKQQAEYRKKHADEIRSYLKTYVQQNKSKVYSINKLYREEHKDRLNDLRKKLYSERRSKLFELLGGPICSRCGCNDLRVLEINHVDRVRTWAEKNGKDGSLTRKQMSAYFGRALTDKVVKGELSPDGLEVVCKVCNAAHYLEDEFGIHFKIQFVGEVK